MAIRTILSDKSAATVMEQNMTAVGATDPVRVRGAVAIQYTGAATAITSVVERSTIDPSSGSANWARVEDTAVTGNPSTGMTVASYAEPAIAWWRVRLTALTGASVTVSISGTA